MKYEKGKILVDGIWKEINLIGISVEKAMDITGKVCCPGENCDARLFAVHSSKNGGRTVHFKASNHAHIISCQYRIENYKTQSVNVSENGYFTEKQVNDFVRTLYNDVTMPIEKKVHKKEEGKNKKTGQSAIKKDDTGDKKISYVGKIISGEDIEGAVKGRMSRRFEVNTVDIGRQVGVYGNLKDIVIDEYGQVHARYIDERYSNIEVLIGSVYQNSNDGMYKFLGKLKEYFDNNNLKGKASYFVAAGMVNSYNGQLVIEVQAKLGFIIDGLNITKLMTKGIVA